MVVLIAFAFVSGIVTILSPCILPVLPIVLAGSIGRGRARPVGVVTGFVVTFAAFTLGLTAIVHAFRLPPDILRYVAIALLVGLGVVMLVPRFSELFERLVSRTSGRVRIGSGTAGAGASAVPPGFRSGLPVGFTLGAVWAPCVGPIMASVIGLALTRSVDGGAVLITAAYALGTAIPMLAVMLGGRALLNRIPGLTRRMAGIQRGFGVAMIVIGVSIGFGWDRRFQNAVLRAFPGYGARLTALEDTPAVRGALRARAEEGEALGSTGSLGGGAAFQASLEEGILGDYGPAPPLVAAGPWLNADGLVPPGSAALSMTDLRDKVVLLDFWTYSCVNCVRTIPYLRAWYETYRDAGLVIIGVHTPEFEFEKKTANVQQAVRELGVSWPVVQDNDYAQWRAYGNRYWPAHYLIDASGRVRYVHFGEGRYDATERAIRALLKQTGAALGRRLSQAEPEFSSQTPETYLGWNRTKGFVSQGQAELHRPAEYLIAHTPGNGEWGLEGRWIVTGSYVEPAVSIGESELRLGFLARNVFLVIEPEEPGGVIEVRVDGRIPRDTEDVREGVLVARESRLYQLVALPEPGEHVLDLKVKGRLRLFAFTFG